MTQPLHTEAVKTLLEAWTHPDLSALYNANMELQCTVDQDGGERVEGDYKGRQWHGWTDGATTWKSFRIPMGANSEPHYVDRPMTFDLAAHALGIGMTGWDWVERCSRWVGFDFDAIVGHADRHQGKLTDAQLVEVEKAAREIPWVTTRRSTSGKGLHLYVFLDGFPTSNHTEHQAVARAILGMMSGHVGYDFKAKVDVCGSNMWVWHRKMKGTAGLTLLKKGTTLYDIPSNWRDHVKVVSGQRRKTLPNFIGESSQPNAEGIFEELTGQRAHVPLDEEHKRVIAWLRENQAAAWWDSDYHMLVTHTIHLRDCHEALGLRGTFKTESRHSSEQNCFCFPLRKGAWTIRRYTPGVKEDPSWDQDASGYTRCYFNREPDLFTAARSNGGLEHPSGGYHFREAEQAQKAALQLGADLNLPAFMMSRNTKLKEHKDGRLNAEITHESSDNPEKMEGWIQEGKNWKKVFNVQAAAPVAAEVGNYDDVVRHLVSESDEDYGWVLKSDNNWRIEPLVHVKTALRSFGLSDKETTGVLGSSVFRPWMMVNRPFDSEYPGDRQWNRGAAQLRFQATIDRDNLKFPTWLKILEHAGRGLNDAIKDNGWARANGILTGADYLKCWIASLFQSPGEPLPYIFLYSEEQNTGKSILHEALSLLVSRGVVRADVALTSQQGFNAELEKAILCVVEETDLKRHKVAYNRIKDWVTSREISIHRKGDTPYTIPNTTHWIQCANDHSACPVFSGDTRITMIRVEPLDPMELIPKKVILPLLEKEAPDFLADVLALEIPSSGDRLNVPVIMTDEKKILQESNQTYLQMFLRENTYHVTGEMIPVADFYDRFKEWLDPQFIHEWSKVKTGREMPPQYPKGRNNKGQWNWGNISWHPFKPGDSIKPRLAARGEMLVSVSEAAKA